MERTNPLAAWLEKRDMKPYLFARQIGVAYETIYRLVSDRNARMPTVETLMAIEAGTGGQVSMRHMTEYLSPLPTRTT